MAVIIGSARIDERGKASGGQAGDQTGRELSTQNWYLHSKGWRVFRAKNPAVAEKIAQDMQWACANSHIGYDQGGRLTLYTVSKPLGFNCSKVTKNCETDCSALVRVCCAYAGVDLPNFRTTNEASCLLKSGAFTEMTGDKYQKEFAYLRRGDILVTKTQGHTVVVLTNGSKAEPVQPVTEYELGERTLRNGDTGPDVKQMQQYLIDLGFSCGKYGADGDFGDNTEMAVKDFQRSFGLDADGVFGPTSYKMLVKALTAADKPTGDAYVLIVGGNCYVRKGPSKETPIIGVAYDSAKWPYAGLTDEDTGWLEIEFKNKVLGWVSPKYGRLVE